MSVDGGDHAGGGLAAEDRSGGYALPAGLDKKPLGDRPKLTSLDADYHESMHSRRSMSSRRLVTDRYEDLLRSGSTHQLLNRPTGRYAVPGNLSGAASSPLTSAEAIAREAAVASSASSEQASAAALAAAAASGAAEGSLGGTEETAEDSDSVNSEDSFCDASGDCAADREYLRKDLGASLHDDELDFDSDGDEEDEKKLLAEVQQKMKIEGGPLAASEGEDDIMGEQAES